MPYEGFDKMAFREIDLDGFKVYFRRLPTIKKYLNIRIIIRGSARLDPAGKDGLAHFLEHVVLEATEKFSTKRKMEEANFEIFDDTLNAETDFDLTAFFGTCRREIAAKAIGCFKEVIFHPLMRKASIEKERKIIIREIWDNFHNRKNMKLLKEFHGWLYHFHPLKRMISVCGWPETVRKLTRSDLIRYHRKYYHLGNMALFLVGDIDEAEARKLGESFARGEPKSNALRPPRPILRSPVPLRIQYSISERREFGSHISSQAKRSVIWFLRIIPRSYSGELIGLAERFLCQILMWEIRERRSLCYGVDVGDYSLNQPKDKAADHYLLQLKIPTAPAAAPRVVELIRRILNDIGSQKYAHYFEWVKRGVLTQFYNIKSPDEISSEAADDWIRDGKITSQRRSYKTTEEILFPVVAQFVREQLSSQQIFFDIRRP